MERIFLSFMTPSAHDPAPSRPRLLLVVTPERKPFEEAQAQARGKLGIRFFPTPLDALAEIPSSLEGGPLLVWLDGALVFQAEAGALRLADRAYPRVPLLVSLPDSSPSTRENLEILLQGTRAALVPLPEEGAQVLEEVENRLGPLHPWNEMGSLLGDLVQGVADALNNPLATLSGYLQLLEMQLPGEGGHPTRATLAQAREGLGRLERVVQDLELAAGERRAGREEEVDLVPFLQRILQEEDPEERLFARRNLPTQLKWKGDPALFGRAFHSLLHLARILVPPGIPVLVDARDRGTRILVEIFLPASRPSSRWRPERTFHPFFLNRALQAPEIGLSPAVAAGAARALGGEARAQWEEGGGLRLFLDLPGAGPVREESSPG